MAGETQEKQNIEQANAPLQTVNLQQSQDFIENVFKDKVEDHALYSKITDIFTEVRKQVPDNLAKDFLQNKSIPILIKRLKMKEKEDAIQYLTGEIDDQNKNETQIATYENKINATDSQLSTAESKLDINKKANEAFQKVKDSYDKLDGKYKPNKEQLTDFEKNIPADTKAFFEANRSLNYDDYLQFAYTATTFKEEPAVKDFASDYKNLNDILHLPDISPAPVLKTCTRIENVEELTKDNASLNTYISKDENFSAIKQTDF